MSELFTQVLPIVFFGGIAVAALVYIIHLIALGMRHGWNQNFEVSLNVPTLILRTSRMLPITAVNHR